MDRLLLRSAERASAFVLPVGVRDAILKSPELLDERHRTHKRSGIILVIPWNEVAAASPDEEASVKAVEAILDRRARLIHRTRNYLYYMPNGME